MPETLQQLFNDPTSFQSVNVGAEAIAKLLLALVLGIVIAKVYKHVHKGISYSESYAFSIVIVTMIVAFVMMVIGGNVARAFTLLGAFTIIRYRTAVKDPKDTAFIFLALVVGLGVGASVYELAITGTIMIALAALLLDKINFGSLIKLEQILYLTVEPKSIDQKSLEVILKGLFKEISVINVNFNSSNNSLQYSYNVKLIKNNDQTGAIDKIAAVRGVRSAEILASQQVVEF